jgi:hypothetical protein
MAKFDLIIDKYSKQGLAIADIEYAISAVQSNTKRAHIIENLNADYRAGMSDLQANLLLNDLYKVNGGEFKNENRWAFIYGVLLLLAGLGFGFYIFYVFTYGGIIMRPILVSIAAIAGTFGGLFKIIQSLRGKVRDNDDSYVGY